MVTEKEHPEIYIPQPVAVLMRRQAFWVWGGFSLLVLAWVSLLVLAPVFLSAGYESHFRTDLQILQLYLPPASRTLAPPGGAPARGLFEMFRGIFRVIFGIRGLPAVAKGGRYRAAAADLAVSGDGADRYRLGAHDFRYLGKYASFARYHGAYTRFRLRYLYYSRAGRDIQVYADQTAAGCKGTIQQVFFTA